MKSAVEQILTLSPVVVCLVVGALVFVEDALFLGFVIPGETAAILGGVAASRGHLSVTVVIVVVVVAAIAGDSVGYEVGRHGGQRVLQSKLLARHQGRLSQAQTYLAEKGGMAVFLGRWIAFFRAVMPALAGVSRMPYPKFLAFNVAGGLLWSVAVVLTGFLAGNAYKRIEHALGWGGAAIVGVIVVTALVIWHRKRAKRAAASGQHGEG